MKVGRRKFISIVGGGIVVAAAAGVGGFAMTRRPGKALQPWLDAGSAYTEPRRKALSYAILAPNPHNRQPWLVDLSRDGEVMLFVDRTRLLPHTDPYDRQITIGLGCFLELLVMAANADGHQVDVQLFPDGAGQDKLDDRPVARIDFAGRHNGSADPLFQHVLDRRSNKQPYDLARPVPGPVLDRLKASIGHDTGVDATNDTGRVATLRRLSEEALMVELQTPRTYKESVDLFRIGKAEINENPDGISFPGPVFEAMNVAGLFTREQALDKESEAFKGGIDHAEQTTGTAMAHLWLVTPGNSRREQITAGRDWVRVNLAATAQEVAIHPLSQALQEYPEMAAYYGAVHEMLAPGGGTVQMFARLGYAETASESPRWPLTEKLIEKQA